ncbi:hypothetical protein V1506DRAFT_570236 [Lipomyces tetrasporus]
MVLSAASRKEMAPPKVPGRRPNRPKQTGPFRQPSNGDHVFQSGAKEKEKKSNNRGMRLDEIGSERRRGGAWPTDLASGWLVERRLRPSISHFCRLPLDSASVSVDLVRVVQHAKISWTSSGDRRVPSITRPLPDRKRHISKLVRSKNVVDRPVDGIVHVGGDDGPSKSTGRLRRLEGSQLSNTHEMDDVGSVLGLTLSRKAEWQVDLVLLSVDASVGGG